VAPGGLEVADGVIHYHGGPITPETCAVRAWSGRHAFVSFAHPRQVELAASICQSFALDNGAFSLWKASSPTDWPAYYEWADKWLGHPACDWAVIPDVIEGTEEENDALIAEWPHGPFFGVPVWHLNESVERLVRLAEAFPRVALGSAAEYDVSRPAKCIQRLQETLPAISVDGIPKVKLHGLRMLNPAIVTKVPLSSADSTNVARNIKFDSAWKGTYAPNTKEARTDVLVARIEAHQSPVRLEASVVPISEQYDLFGSPITTDEEVA
jgi:hypothetical protein